jgi:hypothetical protein
MSRNRQVTTSTRYALDLTSDYYVRRDFLAVRRSTLAVHDPQHRSTDATETAMSWPTRQLLEARLDQVALVATAVLAVWIAAAAVHGSFLEGAVLAALMGLAAAVAFPRVARRARRARIGRASEQLVQRSLATPLLHGWEIRHSVPWPRRGDIDHIASPPSGPVFPTETKTSRYDRHHHARTVEAAKAVARVCGRPAIPVICLARQRNVDRWDAEVLVVSPDRIAAAFLREARYVSTERAIA